MSPWNCRDDKGVIEAIKGLQAGRVRDSLLDPAVFVLGVSSPWA